MTTVIFLFALAFLAGGGAQQGRSGKSPTSRKIGFVIAIVFTLIYFGYVLGKDLAHRKNFSKSSSVSLLASGQPALS